MVQTPSWIAVVDDDSCVRKALARLLRVRSFHAKSPTSAREFLAAVDEGAPTCLIVHLEMPQMTGLELLLHLQHDGIQIPAIIITAHGNDVVRKPASPLAPSHFFPSRCRTHRCSLQST